MERKKISKLAQATIDSVNTKTPGTILTKVVSDWQQLFSDLRRYKTGQKLLKRVGPVVFGIELEKYFQTGYRPTVILFNLIDCRSNRLVYVIDKKVRNERGLEYIIDYSEHTEHYHKASMFLVEQSPISLFGALSIEYIIKSIISYVENDSVGNCFWSCQAVMQLSQLIEDEQKKETFFAKGVELMRRRIPMQWLEMQTGGIKQWINDIRNLDAERINDSVKESLRKHKLEEIFNY